MLSWIKRASAWIDTGLLAQAIIGLLIWESVALIQGYDFDWDVLNYHFYNGWAFIHHKVWDNPQVAMRQTYFGPLLDSVFYILVRNMPPMAVAGVIAAFQSLLYPMVFQISRLTIGRFCQSPASATALSMLVALLGVAAPINIWEAGGALGDTTTAVFVVAALLLLIERGYSGSLGLPAVAAVGLLAGIAAGLKLTNLPFSAGLLAAIMAEIVNADRLRRRARAGTIIAVSLGAMAIGFCATYGWWGWVLYRHLGNPIFPSFNNLFRSPYAAPTSFTDAAFALPTLYDKLTFPFLRTSISGRLDPAGLFDLRMAFALPLSAAALAMSLWRHTMCRPPVDAIRTTKLTVPAFLLTSYVAWLVVFPINRYLVSADMLAPLSIVASAAILWRYRPVLWLSAAALAVALPASAKNAWPLFWLPGDHRHGNNGGYFATAIPQMPDLAHSVVAMLGGYPTTFVIPSFPKSTVFARLQGSLFYESPDFYGLTAKSDATTLHAVFGNATGAAVCRALHASGNPIFVLRPYPEDTMQDQAAMNYFGVEYDHASCSAVSSKTDLKIELCKATRIEPAECLRYAH